MSSHHVDDRLKLHTLHGTRVYIWIIEAVSRRIKRTFLRELRRLRNDRRLDAAREAESSTRNIVRIGSMIVVGR